MSTSWARNKDWETAWKGVQVFIGLGLACQRVLVAGRLRPIRQGFDIRNPRLGQPALAVCR